MYIDRWDGENALSVLKGQRLDDRFVAAKHLAARLLMEMNQAEAEGLRQWLSKKDISDDATIESLIEDWRARR